MIEMMVEGSPKARYACVLPPEATEEELALINERKATASAAGGEKDMDVVKSLLKPLQGKCLFHLDGWWTYEYCYEKRVLQYHQEKVLCFLSFSYSYRASFAMICSFHYLVLVYFQLSSVIPSIWLFIFLFQSFHPFSGHWSLCHSRLNSITHFMFCSSLIPTHRRKMLSQLRLNLFLVKSLMTRK